MLRSVENAGVAVMDRLLALSGEESIFTKEGTSRRSKKIRGGGTPRIFSSKGELPENGAEGGTCKDERREDGIASAHVGETAR